MMPLSEAIRLGSTLAPQAFGNFKNETGTCALGAAMEAVGIEVLPGVLVLPNEWVDLCTNPCLICPSCGALCGYSSVSSVVAHLNDYHRWTREAIADWVQTLEDRMEPAAQVKEEEQHVSNHETVGSY